MTNSETKATELIEYNTKWGQIFVREYPNGKFTLWNSLRKIESPDLSGWPDVSYIQSFIKTCFNR